MKRSRRIVNLTFALLILLIGIPCLMTYREAARLERNRALLRAIRQKDVIGVQLLLHQGADPNARELPDPPSGTFYQRLLALFDLLRHGQPKPPSDAPSALMRAVDVDSAPIVTALLTSGARDVNAKVKRDGEYNTAFSMPLVVAAAKSGNAEMVDALLVHGAEIEARDSDGETTLIAAARDTLTDGRGNELPNPMRQAAEQKQAALVRLLLERGVNIQAADNEGYTALARAIEQDNREMAQLLLDKGANPNVQCGTYYKMTPLDIAAGHDDIALVKALLKKGAKVEMQGAESPLLSTSELEMLTLLLDHGANIHARRLRGKAEGETVLTYLARYDEENDNLPAIRLLLKRGADPNERDLPESAEDDVGTPRIPDGATALMWAAHYAGANTVRCLLDHGAKINMDSWNGPPLMWAVENERFDIARLLLVRGADVNIPGEGTTVLMETILMGDVEFTRELLRRGAKVNARDENRSTALHYAVADNDADLVELLLEWGANVNARDKDGHTPLRNAYDPQNDLLRDVCDPAFDNLTDEKEERDDIIDLLQEAGGRK